MRKIFSIILLALYLPATAGMTFHFHYCMDRFAGTSISLNAESVSCFKCGMDTSSAKKKACCRDEQKKIQTDKIHIAAPQVVDMPVFITDTIPSLLELVYLPGICCNNHESAHDYPPPKQLKVPLFIHYCSLTI